MARIRTIKPEFFQSESMAACSPHARLLAIALLQLCDNQGVFLNIPMQVHAHAFPWEAEVKIDALLGELEGIGYVKLYSVKGKRYGLIHNFNKHQRLSGKEAQAGGSYPLPDEESESSDHKKQEHTQGEVEGKQQGSKREAEGKHLDAQERERERERGTGKEIMSGKPDDSAQPPAVAEFDPKKPEHQAIKYLNQKTGRQYQLVEANLKLVRARLREGFTLDDLMAVVDLKYSQWANDKKMREYLRPATLFNAEKFNQYIAQARDPTTKRERDDLEAWLAEGQEQNDFIDGEWEPA